MYYPNVTVIYIRNRDGPRDRICYRLNSASSLMAVKPFIQCALRQRKVETYYQNNNVTKFFKNTLAFVTVCSCEMLKQKNPSLTKELYYFSIDIMLTKLVRP